MCLCCVCVCVGGGVNSYLTGIKSTSSVIELAVVDSPTFCSNSDILGFII